MSKLTWEEIDRRAVDTARVLAADAVERVGNGHPGTAMSLAPVAYLLYQRIMRHDPADTEWMGRDRFILSAGHSSLTQYTQLYLGGFGLELADLEALRTWGSLTPGHPEFGHTKGVEITTGPLGTGIASAVGFAYASRYERGLFDPDAAAGTSPFDHFVYVIAGDGDLQEGVSSEASSLAGHQQLGNLVVIYDANRISIEGDTDVSFTEDVAARYRAYGWDVREVDWSSSGSYIEDVPELFDAIEGAKSVTDKPSLIVLRTVIGWPAPNKRGTESAHGAALGPGEVAATKELLGFDPAAAFVVERPVIEHTRALSERAAEIRSAWQHGFDAWAAANPTRKELLDRLTAGELPEGITDALPVWEEGASVATRAASGKIINALAAELPELWGGSADLAGSNNTTIDGARSFLPAGTSTHDWTGDPYGRVLHFGIREFAMGTILNGIVLHGPTRPFGGTFLIFSDYMRAAVRLAALMRIPSIFVWTHDSVALGADGPTHQPIEQLSTLRAIPGLDVVRPADANETAWAWHTILTRRSTPAGLALSRQNLPVVTTGEQTERGAYVLAEADGALQAILIATGSEVSLALEARAALQAEGIGVRVVSAPCLEWFEEQSDEYREQVLPAAVTARVSVEAGLALSWWRYLGSHGRAVSIEHFGASADGAELLERFGITVEAVLAATRATIAASGAAVLIEENA
ncbi:transketolase [Microbacterium schleiferi]|uniref:transketolase n=1 Tax=Microbacterium schleiferi TaxID=69362 RepID=UPI00311F995C